MPLALLDPATADVASVCPVRTDPAAFAGALARDVERWRPALRFSREQRVHTRIHADENLEAWLLTWLPGQGTDVHDHGGSAGAIAVLGGWLHESVPAAVHPVYGAAAAALPRRLGPVGRWLGPGTVRAFGPATSTGS